MVMVIKMVIVLENDVVIGLNSCCLLKSSTEFIEKDSKHSRNQILEW